MRALPPALSSCNPLRWLTFFGPGAIIASLTIGVGELVFSSRAGAIFGYRLLWFFLLVLVFKWALVLASARHIVLTGAHPFQRWMELPGPRGWFPLVMLLLALPSFPIWVCFHAGTLGTLVSWLTGTDAALKGGAHFLWALGLMAVVLVLCATGGYKALERIQFVIIALMLLGVVAALFILQPDWGELLKGLFVPQPIHYPPWITPETHGEIAARPVWVETATYVGVIGGSSYDYLAYVSYLREKHWGQSARPSDRVLEDCRWLRAPLIDCTSSFVIVLIFCAVFVASGAMVLGPQHKVPAGTDLLSLQAEFVATVHPWLRCLYFVGAFLAIFGTLYGTIEVAPTVLRELASAFAGSSRGGEALTPSRLASRTSRFRMSLLTSPAAKNRLRCWAVAWVGGGGILVLLWSLMQHLTGGAAKPAGLIAILTPANLFTGVLGCGLVCALNLWIDWRFLPADRRMHATLAGLNALAALVFLGLGMKGYWDHSGWPAFLILGGTLAAGCFVAAFANRS